MLLILGFVAYLDQIVRIEYPWHWGDLWHHEVIIAVSISVGMTLLVVVMIENRHIRK